MLRKIATGVLICGCLSLPSVAQALDGLWRSEGYGYVFEINSEILKAFEVTTRTCVPAFTAKRDSGSVPDREATFRTADGDVYFVRAGDRGDHRRLHAVGSASDMRIDRLPEMPAICDRPTGNTPMDNFEVFTRTWAENYISFDLKHVNWEQATAENRSRVTLRTTRPELFEIMKAIIQPFGDAHTSIRAPKLKLSFEGIRPGTDQVVIDLVGTDDIDGKFQKSGMPKILAVIDRNYLRGPLLQFCNGQLEYGHIDSTTGYLRILSFAEYAKRGGFEGGLTALDAALDRIFSDPMLHALVIDVRINFGGYDPYGLVIASRLATGEYLAYTKQARSDSADRDKWTPGDASIVQPSARPGFRGPVVELTGPLTISGGETFTQALMGRTPHITRIGENTQGVFSDVLGRRLPNGWFFGLPNEVYRTSEGHTFDGAGIPPDIPIHVFAAEDLAAGKDPALERAIEALAHRK
jgi:hypothetical protein